MSTPNSGRVDQVKRDEEIERSRTKRSTCLIRKVNKNSSINKNNKLILTIKVIIITMITISIIIHTQQLTRSSL